MKEEPSLYLRKLELMLHQVSETKQTEVKEEPALYLDS
jgi:hypothetical protein